MISAYLISLGVGVVVGFAIIALMTSIGMHRDRAVGPILLVAIAAFYPVFAVDDGALSEVILHGGVFLGFLAIAAISYRSRLVIAGVGLVLHGLFDAWAGGMTDGPEPDWWAPFCLGVDAVLGLWLILSRPWRSIPPEGGRTP